MRRLADEFPTETWSEEALNHLATHYIVSDDDAKADETFREMFARFPSGRYAERAAWKIGWRAYQSRQYTETIRVFERGSANFPRSDWLFVVRVRAADLDLCDYARKVETFSRRSPRRRAPGRRCSAARSRRRCANRGFCRDALRAVDAPGGRLATALCGKYVDRTREHSATLSCATCAQAQADYEALDI